MRVGSSPPALLATVAPPHSVPACASEPGPKVRCLVALAHVAHFARDWRGSPHASPMHTSRAEGGGCGNRPMRDQALARRSYLPGLGMAPGRPVCRRFGVCFLPNRQGDGKRAPRLGPHLSRPCSGRLASCIQGSCPWFRSQALRPHTAACATRRSQHRFTRHVHIISPPTGVA